MLSRMIFVSCLAFVLFFSSIADANSVLFYSYQDALEVAESEHKEIYVLFGADHCPWCHKQKDVLLEDLVSEELSKYIVCYVDTSEERDVAKKYRIRSIPVSMILNSDEKVLKKNVGYMDSEEFIKWIR